GRAWYSETQQRWILYLRTGWPASFRSSRMSSFRKPVSDTSPPGCAPVDHTLFAQASKSRSWVTPRSSVIGLYFVRPGDLCSVLGSPAWGCSMISVVRVSPVTLLTAATGLGDSPKYTTNLKFEYGSSRCGLLGKIVLTIPPRCSAIRLSAESGRSRTPR